MFCADITNELIVTGSADRVLIFLFLDQVFIVLKSLYIRLDGETLGSNEREMFKDDSNRRTFQCDIVIDR